MNTQVAHTVTVQQAHPNPAVTYAITAVVIVVVMALRWRRMRRSLPLRLERLWIVPALYLVIAGIMYWMTPPVGIGWLFCLVALGLGAALGWQRGRMMRITIDPETHALNQTGSPAAMLFLVAIVVLRSGTRAAMQSGAGATLHLGTLAVTDMLVALALGLFTATRVEMYLRGRRMLDAARGGVAIS